MRLWIPSTIARTLASLVVLQFVLGCGSPSPRDYAEYEINPPLGWQSTDTTRYLVPGKALEAWQGPEGASLSVFETLPIPGATAESLTEELATRWSNLPGWTIVNRRVVQISNQPASWIEIIAPGSGDSLASTSQGKAIDSSGQPLKSTRRLAISIPLPKRTLQLMFHSPETAQASARQQWETIITSLHIKPSALQASGSY